LTTNVEFLEVLLSFTTATPAEMAFISSISHRLLKIVYAMQLLQVFPVQTNSIFFIPNLLKTIKP